MPKAFEFSHIIVLAIAIAMVFFFRNLIKRESNRIVRFTGASIMGVILGILGSYVTAQIATPILRKVVPNTTIGPDGYYYLFWALFVSFSFIGLIVGGLVGMIYAKRLDDKLESRTGQEKDAPGGELKRCDRELDRCLDELEQRNNRENKASEDIVPAPGSEADDETDEE